MRYCPRCKQEIPGFVICPCWSDEELHEMGFTIGPAVLREGSPTR